METKEYDKVSDKEFNLMLNRVVAASDTNYAILKVIEEIHEVGEILTKLLTKGEENRPSTLQLVEELGDLQARIAIFTTKIDLVDDVFNRARNKIHMLDEKYTEVGSTKVIINKLK